jgi:limonene-1,2-epoxide hydrolase
MSDIESWVRGYEAAWRTNDPEQVGALFASDAVYLRAPHDAPIEGREAIVAFWVGEQDPPEIEFRWSVAGTDGSRSFVEGRTVYPNGKTYRNLWVVDLDDVGRASRFVEWWMTEETT